MSEHFGEDHDSIAEILKNMAACYEKQEFHELALETFALAHRVVSLETDPARHAVAKKMEGNEDEEEWADDAQAEENGN